MLRCAHTRPILPGAKRNPATFRPASRWTLLQRETRSGAPAPPTKATKWHGWRVLLVGAWLAIGVHALADVPGDADLDGDVDFNDFAQLAACQAGPDVPISPDCHEFFDLDFDFDVDMPDLAAFQRCFSGQNQPASPYCASHLARIEDGCLHIIGTAASTTLALRLRAGVPAILEVDVDNDGSADFSFDRGLFDCIVVDARGGNDLIWIDEANGVFTDTEQTTVNGGYGNDTLFGGSGGETFNGGPQNDAAYLGAGDDRVIGEPDGSSDYIEGGEGSDVVEVNGGEAAENFTIVSNGTRVRFDRLDPAPFFLDIGTCESLVLYAHGGDDSLACAGNLAALIQIAADGGAGDDTLLGSNAADLLLGGDGNDFIDGNQGSDVVFLGAGDDVFQWDPGDGSDTVEGQAGHDVVLFNGSNAAEIHEFAANGSRLRFTRNVGNVILDAAGVEQFDLRALGGEDTVTVNDLTGTDVAEVNVDLSGTLGGNTGDGLSDVITVNGTALPDTIHVAANSGAVEVSGLAASIGIAHSEGANDTLIVNGLGGADTITFDPGVLALIMLVINQ